jgi:hypothetical protein
MGACTVTLVEQTVFGNKRVVYGRIAASTSYAAGGETFTAAQMGLDVIDKMVVIPSILVSTKAYIPVIIPTGGSWPATGGKMALVGGSASSGLAEGSGDLSAFTQEFQAWGV